MFANMASQSAEVMEAEQPVEILAYELVQDRAGPGKFRGGAPYRRDIRLEEAEAVLQIRSDRKKIRPYGLYGGRPGRPSANVLNPHRNAQHLESKVTTTMFRGDVIRHEWAGGGGWGDPLERDPAQVLRDVRNEYVSAESARDDYGVVVDTAAWTVDEAATEARRGASGPAARPRPRRSRGPTRPRRRRPTSVVSLVRCRVGATGRSPLWRPGCTRRPACVVTPPTTPTCGYRNGYIRHWTSDRTPEPRKMGSEWVFGFENPL